MTEISAASPNEEEQEQDITITEFTKTQKQFMKNMQVCFRNMLLKHQRHSPVGLIGQGLMRKTLMMHHSRRVMTEIFTEKSLVQVEKENV